MNPANQLHATYQEWRRLAEAKGEAIRSGNWALMADCQKAINDLQLQISRLTNETREQWASDGLARPAGEASLRELITAVLQLESRNSDLLQSGKQQAGDRLAQLQRAGRLLHRVQRLYAPSRPAAWSSLS